VKLAQRTINSIIDENFVFAKVLDYFGVAFYKYSGHTLEALCKEKNLPLDKVLRNMERYKPQSQFDKNTIATYPVDLIIEYLKHSHHIFIKQKLPYLARLIKAADGDVGVALARYNYGYGNVSKYAEDPTKVLPKETRDFGGLIMSYVEPAEE